MSGVTSDGIGKSFAVVHPIRRSDTVVLPSVSIVRAGPSGCGVLYRLWLTTGLKEFAAGSLTIGARILNSAPKVGEGGYGFHTKMPDLKKALHGSVFSIADRGNDADIHVPDADENAFRCVTKKRAGASR